jgi:hypothetical protein
MNQAKLATDLTSPSAWWLLNWSLVGRLSNASSDYQTKTLISPGWVSSFGLGPNVAIPCRCNTQCFVWADKKLSISCSIYGYSWFLLFCLDENITWHTASSKGSMFSGGIHTCLFLVCCSNVSMRPIKMHVEAWVITNWRLHTFRLL